MNDQERHRYKFGPFCLDPEARTLTREGRQVPITPKAFDTLLELVRGSGRVLDRDELMKRVWPDSFVEEGNLKVTIFMLRKALEEDPAVPRFIQTVPRRGYRFAAEVIETDTQAEARDEAYGRPVSSIAVLPFKLLTGAECDDYLAIGLADALIVRLSKLRQVTVRPTSSVRKFGGADQDPVAAGRALGVEAVLDGNIHLIGDRVRVTAQLIHVAQEAPLWADKFDARFTNIFEVEDSISEQVGEALTLKLTGEDRERLTKHYTEDIEAYQHYLKGRYYWSKRTSIGTRRAVEHFQSAIDLDPQNALAYTGLADCYTQLGWMRLRAPADVFPAAKAAATRALELDEELGEAHTSLAWARLQYDWAWADTEASFSGAIARNPNYAVAHMWYGVFLIVVGRFDEAVTELRLAQELDPLSPIINALVGWPYYFNRSYQRSIELYHKALQLEPHSLPALLLLGRSRIQIGEATEGAAEVQKALKLEDSAFLRAELGHAFAVAGRKDEARSVLDKLTREAEQTYISPYDLAGIQIGLGETDAALRLLEKACEDRSAWLIFLGVEPRWDPLRSDPRFDQLLRRTGLVGKSLEGRKELRNS